MYRLCSVPSSTFQEPIGFQSNWYHTLHEIYAKYGQPLVKSLLHLNWHWYQECDRIYEMCTSGSHLPPSWKAANFYQLDIVYPLNSSLIIPSFNNEIAVDYSRYVPSIFSESVVLCMWMHAANETSQINIHFLSSRPYLSLRPTQRQYMKKSDVQVFVHWVYGS